MLDEGISCVDGYEPCQAVMSTGLALYGEMGQASQREVFEEVIRQFDRVGCSATHIGSDALKSNRIYTFRRSARAVAANCKIFGVFSLPDGLARRRFAEDSGAYFDSVSFALTFRSSLLPNGGASLLEAAHALVPLLKPVYGIIYEVPLAFGPTEYGGGSRLNSGRAVQDWGMEVLRFRLFHFLRNAYQWNFLTNIQLKIRGSSALRCKSVLSGAFSLSGLSIH